jgi:hypothetical protein
MKKGKPVLNDEEIDRTSFINEEGGVNGVISSPLGRESRI